MMKSTEFRDGDTLAQALAARVADCLAQRLLRDGAARLAVSGGRTPTRFFQALAQQDIDWQSVAITLVDERWVDESSPRSNAALVRASLLTGQAAAAAFLPLYQAGFPPQAGLAVTESLLAALGTPFAAVVLGVGDDGHTASFFPGGDRLAQALDPANDRLVEIMQAPGAGEPRITQTLNALLASDLVAIHVEGDNKKAVLARAMQPGPVQDLPVRAVLRQTQTPVEIFWCP